VKKVFSILTVTLVITGMFHISVAWHYCGGKIAASKISLSGKLATCGMEGTKECCSIPGYHLKTHCCDDIVNVYSVESTYSPSYSVVTDITKNVVDIPVERILPNRLNNFFSITNYSDHSPPGFPLSTEVDLSDICVFRI
jgi:hypothetical protein